MSVALVRYDAACKALAEANAVDEVKQIRDVAEAMRAYARQAQNKQLEADAWEIRIRAERRIGELIAEQKATVGLGKPGPKKIGLSENPISLSEALGPNHKNIADRARKYAAVPESEFAQIISDGRERVIESTRRESARVIDNLVRAGEREQLRGDIV
jgi:hypothetical protein